MSLVLLIKFLLILLMIFFSIESVVRNRSLLNIITSIIFFWIALILGFNLLKTFTLTNGILDKAILFLKLENFSIYSIGGLLFVFSFYFPNEKSAKLNPSLLFYFTFYTILCLIVSVSGIIFTSVSFPYDVSLYFPQSNIPYFAMPIPVRIYSIKVNYSLWHYLFSVFSITNGLWGVGFILSKYRKSILIYQKKQIRYFLFALSISLILTAFALVLKKFLFNLVYILILTFSLLLSTSVLFYSIISYRFVNFRKKLVFLIKEFFLNFLVVLPFILFLVLLKNWVARFSLLSYVLFFICIFLFLIWFQKSTIRILKQIFNLKINEDLMEILFDKIGHSTKIEELAKNTINTVIEFLNVKGVHFLFFEIESETFKTVYSSSNEKKTIAGIEPLFRHFKKEIDFFDREIINFDPKYSNIRELANKYFEKYNIAMTIPLFYENLLIALINLEYKIDNNSFSKDEFDFIKKLRKVVNLTLSNIILFEKEEEAKLTKRDLILASQIQDSIFQRNIPIFENMDIYAYQKPAKEVSGDYFYIHKIDENRVGFVVADVSGKGFSAALISMMIHTISKSHEFSSNFTSGLVVKINEVMTSNNGYGEITKMLSFATVFCGYIDRENKILYYTSAGHHPALLYNTKTKDFKLIKATSRPVGIFADEFFPAQKTYINDESILVVYTDGITEAINESEEEYGLERLKKVISKNSSLNAKNITQKIIDSVEDFVNGKEQFDDITLVVIKL